MVNQREGITLKYCHLTPDQSFPDQSFPADDETGKYFRSSDTCCNTYSLGHKKRNAFELQTDQS